MRPMITAAAAPALALRLNVLSLFSGRNRKDVTNPATVNANIKPVMGIENIRKIGSSMLPAATPRTREILKL